MTPFGLRPVRGSLAALVLAMCACDSSRPAPKPPEQSPVTSTAALPDERYESAKGRFELSLPGTFTGAYRVKESVDTVLGARLAEEIVFPRDSTGKVPPRTLLVVRVFTRARWDRVMKEKGPSAAIKLAERGDDVFALSMIGSNPYKFGTDEAKRVDQLMFALTEGGLKATVTPR